MKPLALALLVRQIGDQLLAAALPQSCEQAQWLVSELLQVARFDFVLYPDRLVDEQQVALVLKGAQRLLAGEPLAYIAGRCEFDGLELLLSPAVLIPRGETELLVQRVMEKIEQRRLRQGHLCQEGGVGTFLEKTPATPSLSFRALDLGTGSGCLAIALARRLASQPGASWQMGASDISPEALAIARANAAALNCSIDFRQGDWIEPWKGDLFDLVVSNPPYIGYHEIADMSSEVLNYEPAGALFADQEGLAVYAHLAAHLLDRVKPGGLVALEIGWLQSAAVEALFNRPGWVNAQTGRDLSDHPRFFFVERE